LTKRSLEGPAIEFVEAAAVASISPPPLRLFYFGMAITSG
jgi:hypothetical protein